MSKQERQKRRQMRQLARHLCVEAAESMGVTMLEFVKLVKAEDEVALAALAETVQGAEDVCAELGFDWGDIDWDQLIETILKFIEMFILIFSMF